MPSEEGDRELGSLSCVRDVACSGGFCAQVCPVDAITSGAFERSVMDRDGLIYTKTELAAFGAQNETWWGADTPTFSQN
ncbi:MAG: hypothetical protein M9890_00025 [Thermomicrobiales bacterium]|nr:hypothetical protein [Thermomicrobiales bacterium]